jgi:hypothetical protein
MFMKMAVLALDFVNWVDLGDNTGCFDLCNTDNRVLITISNPDPDEPICFSPIKKVPV